ncbi:hypothetical protein H4CHR_04378 [Variovorax sp. PBS-H4]|uniref:phage fiber-tail adaptor protein n=1 Tax=Variovorax sp. PBS-H4 TaxID=434008 RepID=UPI0013197020|nr:hypothetical protein [Variovorax sp. PBS-H4]VTU38255.1 hypothetical protein H4CHR_04378 [Variovorax sp. PBS-H4]
MAILGKQRKQPRETWDYDIDYAGDMPVGDKVVSASASVVCITDPTDTALTKGSVTFTDLASKVWLSGGTDKHSYKITVFATTEGGRELEDEFILNVKED